MRNVRPPFKAIDWLFDEAEAEADGVQCPSEDSSIARDMAQSICLRCSVKKQTSSERNAAQMKILRFSSKIHSGFFRRRQLRLSSMPPDAPRCSQMLPDAPRCSQMLPEAQRVNDKEQPIS